MKVFRVGGKGPGFVVTDFFAVSGLGSAWSIAGPCRFFGMGAVVGGCAYRDTCLDVLGFAVRLRCPILGVDMASYLLWAGQSLNQNVNSKCVVCMKLFMTLEHF